MQYSEIVMAGQEIVSNYIQESFSLAIFDSLVKSQGSDDNVAERSQAVKRFRCKARKYEGMRRTYWYAAMTVDAAQRCR